MHPFQNSFIYKPCQSDAASLPDTSCHSSHFIGFTQLRDLSVGRDFQTTEKMRLRNGTIFIDMLSLLLTCALASVLSFLLSSQSRVTPPSLSLVFLFFPFYSSAPDGLSALGEPIAKSAQAERCAGLVLAILRGRSRSVAGAWAFVAQSSDGRSSECDPTPST